MNEYEALLKGVVDTHIDEIEADLERAQHELRNARSNLESHEGRVSSLQVLVDLTSSRPPQESGSLTLHDAMAVVLEAAPEHMMRAGDIAKEIERRRLYRMRDGRPVEAQQIHARVGHYGDRFEKEGTFIRLRGPE